MSDRRRTEIAEASLGNLGSKAVIGTTPVTPPTDRVITALIPLTNCVVTAQTDRSGVTNQDLTAFTTLPAGIPIYGQWTSITLSADNEATAYFG